MSITRIREVEEADLERCFEIESVSYQGDEAASREKISKRILTYPEGFIVLEEDGQVVGFINCGATHEVELSDEAFKELVGHDPRGEHIVIMSVVVHPDHQGRGYANQMMAFFITKMKKLNKSAIHLICRTDLVPMYSRQGYKYMGESDSDHGGLSWHEMMLSLRE